MENQGWGGDSIPSEAFGESWLRQGQLAEEGIPRDLVSPGCGGLITDHYKETSASLDHPNYIHSWVEPCAMWLLQPQEEYRFSAWVGWTYRITGLACNHIQSWAGPCVTWTTQTTETACIGLSCQNRSGLKLVWWTDFGSQKQHPWTTFGSQNWSYLSPAENLPGSKSTDFGSQTRGPQQLAAAIYIYLDSWLFWSYYTCMWWKPQQAWFYNHNSYTHMYIIVSMLLMGWSRRQNN